MNEGKKNTRNYKIPVLFHNLKGYDAHLIMSAIGEHVNGKTKINVIAQNYEKYVTFGYNNLKYLDSFGFLTSGLDALVANLYDERRNTEDGEELDEDGFKQKFGGKYYQTLWKQALPTRHGLGVDKFVHTKQHCKKPENLELLLTKGVYPYDYMNSFARFEETKLPPKEKFYSKLYDGHISDEKYEHAQKVWDAFECKNIGDYHDLYCKFDVLQLTDVFENFREICLKAHGLDPVHY